MKVSARPVAYIRRSARSRSDPGDLSREFQVDKVRQLAGVDGPTLEIIDQDWGRSAATEKTDQRLAFLALLERVERGEITALYAYATDRLARSVEWAARLLNACRRAGTVIVTSEGRFEPDNDMTDQLFYFQAMQNEGYSRQSKRKRDATVARLRARGEKLGPKFYGELPGENVQIILDTFEEAGSTHRTAYLLNQRHVPTRRGVAWTHSTVRQILVRHGRAPKLGVRGAKPRAPHRLYRLLRCDCGRVLSGVLTGGTGRNRRTIYRCVNSTADPAHGVKSVAEAKLMPWVMAEAERYSLPAAVEIEERSRRRDDLDAQRVHVTRLALVPGVDLETVEAQLAAIDRRIAGLEDEAVVEEVGAIDWENTPPAELNLLLRAYWREIRLDRDMRPMAADWRIARMRV